MIPEIKQFDLNNGAKENWYAGRDTWRCVNDICKNNLEGDYKILFNNITDCSTFPEVLKFVAFDWENIKLLVYREPELRIYSFEDYNKCLRRLKANETLFLSEGMHQEDNEQQYKRLFLLKDLDKQTITELRKGEKIIKQGAYLSTCWGYDQTNIELFVIKKIIGNNYMIIQEIAQEAGKESGTPCYDNVKVAKTIKKIDLPVKAYVSNDGYMSVCEHGYKRSLSLTNLEEEHYKTNSQFGH